MEHHSIISEPRAKELIKHFIDHGISHDPKKLEPVLEFQDIIGRATSKSLAEFEAKMDEAERRSFFWVCANTLGMDTFLDVVKVYVRRKSYAILEADSEEWRKKADARWTEAHDKDAEAMEKEARFNKAKKWIFKRIARMRRDRDFFREAADRLHREAVEKAREILDLRALARENEAKAHKYDNIKDLLK